MRERATDIVFHPNLEKGKKGPTHHWETFEACDGGELGWSAKSTSKEGDLYLFYFGDPLKFVGGVARFTGKRYPGRSELSLFSPVHAHRKQIRLGKENVVGDEALALWWSGRPFQGGPKSMLQHPAAARRLIELILERNSLRKLRRFLAPYLELATVAAVTESVGRLPELTESEKKRAKAEVLRAVRDRRLRPAVLELWGPQCAACGMKLCAANGEEPWECEVAHLDEVCANEVINDSIDNALPLCRTHHWASVRVNEFETGVA